MSNFSYSINSTPIKNSDYRLLYISTSMFEKDWHSTLHTHHFTELFYVLRGKGSFLINEEEIPVKTDDLIIINPNVDHTEIGEGTNPFEYIVLGIEGLQFATLDEKDSEDYSIHNYYEFKHEVLFYLKTLVSEVTKKEEDYERLCQNLLEILLINVIRRTKKQLIVTPAKKITKECRFIEQYISNHFHENITLEKLSELTYMNKYYIIHAFKKYKGVSPMRFLLDKRMEETKHLLLTTNYSIAQISNMLGFSSQSYFAQTFKKETSMSPNQYRKAAEKEK